MKVIYLAETLSKIPEKEMLRLIHEPEEGIRKYSILTEKSNYLVIEEI